ncbi:hypothetical protein K505DRAFT_356151 [Melanomma pulvis-pyrius CBS 109.77]|uniref:COP9 signalosome complex subunit 3 n=1 Tax=Melanomma pulvis-pyrius CBS 109.77 TaxID=1314802 RepID=A0A6A6XTU6_9PLEO|nr:hypothetical protein K505DRAFT_356151 [Melanomma pulvis-pyrius CBS 109.77]
MSSDLFSFLFSFPPDARQVHQKRDYDSQARSFVQQIANTNPQYFLKGVDTSQDLLEVLHPAVNTIAYLFTLRIRIATLVDNPKAQKHIPEPLRPGGSLWNKIVLFLETCDPVQIRYAGPEWKRVVEAVEVVARVMGTPSLAISPIRSAMIRLDPSTGTFTMTHLSFIRLCVQTRSYSAALPILDNYLHSLGPRIPQQVQESLEYSVACADHTNSGEYIHQMSGHSDKISLADVQEYYILGAMAYIGTRQFKKAMHFLEHVLIVPTSNVANGFMLEAYKKWVLVSCLVDGSMKPAPRTANGQAIKTVRNASKAYETVADAFTQLNNLPKLKAQINAGRDIWAEDGNTGLVNELRDQQYRFYVSDLSRTFSAIPVANISNAVGGSVEELTDYLSNLIKEGSLNARIEQSAKAEVGFVLRFFLDPTQGPLAKTERQQQQALFEQTQRTHILAEQVKGADYRLSLTKEYVEHLKRASRKPTASGGDVMDTTWDDSLEVDEDIMGDH